MKPENHRTWKISLPILLSIKQGNSSFLRCINFRNRRYLQSIYRIFQLFSNKYSILWLFIPIIVFYHYDTSVFLFILLFFRIY